MALIQCPECKKDVSDSAPACPSCGYEFKSAPVKVIVKKKGLGCFGLFGILVIVIIIIVIINSISDGVKKANLTPEEKSKIEAAQKIRSEREKKFGKEGSRLMVSLYLRDTMKDPDSLELSCGDTFYNDKDGWIIKCDWRGKNSFGGYVRKINWFVMRHGSVVKVADENAYK